MEKPRYPIGEQHFKQLREYGYIYVDKTDYIDRLLANRFYFLSRPRRFGKSLFLSTLEQFFLGNKEIFHGLAIEKADWNWDQFPVLRISFGNGSFTSHDGLEERMTEIVEENEERYQIEPKGSNPRARLRNLLRQLFKKTGKGVVILVDEYEKPLLDAYGKDIFDSTREKLSEFYSVFKDNTEYIRFLFITGITRFGQLNIFSGLNNLQDISLDPEYSAICGITEEEIRQYFSSGIENFAKIRDISIEDAFQALKKYYDGYHFSETLVDIYNPWALLNSLKSGMLTADWFASGSPNYLLKILRQKNYDLKGLLGSKVNENKLRGNGVDIMYPTSLLYQSGYLTIKDYDRKENLYTLGLPNFEVRTALLESIIPFYLGKDKEMDSEKES